VDSLLDRVYRYTNAAGRLDRSQNAASSFALANGNNNPKGIVTDGTSLWVVDDSSTDKVFKYSLAGALLGSWTIDAANAHPTGLTLNPSAPSDLWIVDNGTDRVYQYAAAAGRTSGSQSAAASFALAAGNSNPQDIADPPDSTGRRAAEPVRGGRIRGVEPARTSVSPLAANGLPPDDFDFAPVVVAKPRGLTRRF
jgi:hypothetical protein